MVEPTSIRDVLRAAWRRWPDRTALVTANGATTFAELEDRSLRLANALAELGAGPNDPVGCVVTPDCNIQLEVRFATSELGATLFAIPPDLLAGGASIVASVDPRVVIYDPRSVPGIPEWLHHVCPNADALPARSSTGDYGGLLAAARAEPIASSYDPDGLTAVGFTSGTTGPPKGITATHHASAWSCSMMRRILGDAVDGAPGGTLIGIPVFAAGGGVVVPTLAAGGTIYAPDRFDPIEVLHLIDRGEVTSAFLSPSMVIDLLDVPDLHRYRLGALRSIVYGTSIMPVPKLAEAVRAFGPVLMGGYGMAEVLPPVAVLLAAEHGTAAAPASAEVLSSCGRPVVEVKVRVVSDEGRPLAANQVGEIEVQSPAVTKGYWGDVSRTRASRRNGWWRSGDIGFIDRDDRVHILSRKADVLRHGGEPVYPRIVEETCGLHPAVKEACAVQREPEAPIVVAISLRQAWRGASQLGEITSGIHDLLRSHFGRSSPVSDIMVFEEIPRSVQGKILHREVRRAVISEGELERHER